VRKIADTNKRLVNVRPSATGLDSHKKGSQVEIDAKKKKKSIYLEQPCKN